jgi:hypothetical protein
MLTNPQSCLAGCLYTKKERRAWYHGHKKHKDAFLMKALHKFYNGQDVP